MNLAVAWQCHPDDAHWVDTVTRRLPREFLPPLRRCYQSAADRRSANLLLLNVAERAGRLPLPASADDQDICDLARVMARRCWRMIYRLRCVPAEIIGLLRGKGIDPPSLDKPQALHARATDEHWWRRKLRAVHGRGVEGVARTLHMVHRRADLYASEASIKRRGSQRRRNRVTLEAMQAVNELGDQYTLADLADLSVSNPKIRRGELMVRIAGFEQVARSVGHVAEFYTWTCPSRMHAVHSSGEPNARYDHTTPRAAQVYLTDQWAKARAALHRRGIRPYGLRVAEPHHDGTPHWHLLLFMPPEHRETVRAILHRYALEFDGDEPGAQAQRFKVVEIDPSRGSAAGYVAKYVAKNIDGFGLEADLYGKDPEAGAVRVDTWASTWGIRQFQQIGGPSVTVWRELRRLDHEDCGALEPARAAADRCDWAGYIAAMGGIDCPRESRPVQLVTLQEIDTETGELPLNKYGELAAGRVIGVRCGNVIHVTRWHDWRIERMNGEHGGYDYQPRASEFPNGDPAAWQERLARPESTYIGSVPNYSRADGVSDEEIERIRNWKPLSPAQQAEIFAKAGIVDPWSSVNNCTERLSDP